MADDAFDPYRRGHFDVFGSQDDNASANLTPEQIEVFEAQQMKEIEFRDPSGAFNPGRPCPL